MQQYKSCKNIEIDRKLARHLEKQRGEIPFELESNKSGRATVKFPKEYADVPFILLTPIVNSGAEFDVSVVMTNRTKAEFTVNVQNTGSEPAKGSILWLSE